MPYYIHLKEHEPTTGIPYVDRAEAFRALSSGAVRESVDHARERTLKTQPDPYQGYEPQYYLSDAVYRLRHTGDDTGIAEVIVMFQEATDQIHAGYESARITFTERNAKITFHASYEENRIWHNRERERFRTNVYARVPWTDFYDGHTDHFLHISVKDPGYVAYTPDDESGIRDRQVRVRPGKYLAEFYPHVAHDTIQTWIHSTTPEALQLRLARTADEVDRVYANGPRSCMRSWVTGHDGTCYNKRGLTTSPVIAYGDSDLAVAYMGTLDHVTARAVVWPEEKKHSKVYGLTSVLASVLKENGYTPGDMDGARLRAVPVPEIHGAVFMPYVDNVDHARIDGEWITLGAGSISAQPTEGYIRGEDAVDGDTRCRSCEEWYDGDSAEYQNGLCDACESDRHDCAHCDERCDEDSMQQIQMYRGERWVCDSCVDEHSRSCESCGDEWNDLSVRPGDRGSDYCPDCHDSMEYCEDCSQHFDTREDETCPRCKDDEDSDEDSASDAPDTPIVAPPVPTPDPSLGTWITSGTCSYSWFLPEAFPAFVYVIEQSDIANGDYTLRRVINRDTGACLTQLELRINLGPQIRYVSDPRPFNNRPYPFPDPSSFVDPYTYTFGNEASL